MNDIVTIDKKEIVKLAAEGNGLALTRDAEASLIKLLDLKDFIDQVVEDVKEQIAERARTVYPDFKGVQGEHIRAIYRMYGDKYKTDNPEFQKEIVSVRTDSQAIDEYLEEHGTLPEGVEVKDRTAKLVITRT